MGFFLGVAKKRGTRSTRGGVHETQRATNMCLIPHQPPLLPEPEDPAEYPEEPEDSDEPEDSEGPEDSDDSENADAWISRRVVALGAEGAIVPLIGLPNFFSSSLNPDLPNEMHAAAQYIATSWLPIVARPYLDIFLKTLAAWKECGRIEQVAIFVRERNINGYANFLANCLEIFAETPGLFDYVINRDMCPRLMNGGRIVLQKDLSRLSADPSSVCLIDTGIDSVINGRSINLSVYETDQDTSETGDDALIRCLSDLEICFPSQWECDL